MPVLAHHTRRHVPGAVGREILRERWRRTMSCMSHRSRARVTRGKHISDRTHSPMLSSGSRQARSKWLRLRRCCGVDDGKCRAAECDGTRNHKHDHASDPATMHGPAKVLPGSSEQGSFDLAEVGIKPVIDPVCAHIRSPSRIDLSRRSPREPRARAVCSLQRSSRAVAA